jgi:hypothetical protein
MCTSAVKVQTPEMLVLTAEGSVVFTLELGVAAEAALQIFELR